MLEAEAGLMQLQAVDCAEPPGMGRDEEGFFPEPPEQVQPGQPFHLGLLASGTVRP